MREKVAQGLLITRFVSSKDQVADIFTKPLSRTPFQELCTKLGLWTLSLPSLRGNVEGENLHLIDLKESQKGRNQSTRIKEDQQSQ